MNLINFLINTAFDILLIPFSYIDQFWGIFFISIISGLLLIYIFKITSNQNAIKKIKNKIKAKIFEIRLFDLNPLELIKVLLQILKFNLKYVSYSAVPLIFMMIPVIMIIIQLNFRYGYRPHYPEEKTLLKIYFQDDINIMDIDIDIELHDQAVIDAGPMRNLPNNYIAYQMIVTSPDDSPIDIMLNLNNKDHKISKSFNNNSSIRKISNKLPDNNFLDMALYPMEKPLSGDISQIVRFITITYNENRINLFGISFHYIVFFFIFSLIGGFSFKGLVGAEI